MTKFDQRLPAGDDGVMRRLQDLEREVRELRAARRLEASTIGRGGITIKGGAIILQDTDGREIARMGIREDIPPEPDGDPQPGFILRRNDGSLAFALDDPNPSEAGYRQLLKMQDAQGNVIFSEDYISGWGLATPTHSYPLYSVQDAATWPATVNGSFETLWLNYIPLWNPILEVGASGFAPASHTGEFRLVINGTQYGAAKSIAGGGGGAFDNATWTVAVPSLPGIAPGSVVPISLEARRTVGSSSGFKVMPTWVYGAGSYGTP
ncbi:hypothetical protein HPO96_37015 [Kribbella sandramycini]|uniref:Uncharacterized protein n=1 Tax=Kribbella sandramycini TaxID=60450 RepID=A0A7Y4P3G3_9ACTN|nr:hypothetical protein [Kribbella sandramycini]MBB6564399.1 hypothetical protein [Kribbella sandramycini]NOL45861.1 hypothetical protein [Kribbella sandramycini]